MLGVFNIIGAILLSIRRNDAGLYCAPLGCDRQFYRKHYPESHWLRVCGEPGRHLDVNFCSDHKQRSTRYASDLRHDRGPAFGCGGQV